MGRSIKLSNDDYWSHDSILSKQISQSDYLTLNNGFEITQYDVQTIGKLLIGHILVKATTPFGNFNSEPFSINNPYRPKNAFYKDCGMAQLEWGVDTVGYLYMGGSNCVIVNTHGTYTYAILDFQYQIN